MRSRFKAIAFDNLALYQLDAIEWIGREEYNHLYMGDDGEFTMYLDLVEHTYSKSSMHSPIPFTNESVDELFASLNRG